MVSIKTLRIIKVMPILNYFGVQGRNKKNGKVLLAL